MPARQATIGALIRGRIQFIPAEEGARIDEDAPLFVLDDAIQRARFEMAQADADSKLEVELAKVRMVQAQKELERIQVLATDGRASTKELLDAQALAEATRIEWDVAAHRQVQQERDAALQKQLLAQHTIRAPFAGYVSKVHKKAGDMVEDLESVVVVTQLHPLEVLLDCPVELAARFRENETINVAPTDEQWPPRTGRIVWVNRVADAASQTVRVKIEVDNQDNGWLTGIKVRVAIPEVQATPAHANAESTAPRGL